MPATITPFFAELMLVANVPLLRPHGRGETMGQRQYFREQLARLIAVLEDAGIATGP